MKLELEMTSGGNTSAPTLWRLVPERQPAGLCWEAEVTAPAVNKCPQQVPTPSLLLSPLLGTALGC